MQTPIPAVVMRGGTSRGLYFHKSDLPADTGQRDRLLLAVMGSPDPRQIDGMGGAHPLTSKVAVISPSPDDDADVDYLFLQVFVDKAIVSDGQNCGNILAGVGPFAIENGMVAAADDETTVRIRMLNTGGIGQTGLLRRRCDYRRRARHRSTGHDRFQRRRGIQLRRPAADRPCA